MLPSEIVIRIDRKAFIVAAAIVLLSAAAVRLWSESLTLATTYPAPSGIYNQIVTTGNSGAAAADTTLNRNAGNTILVPPTNPNGKVGIGAVPPSLYRAKLIVGDFITDGGDYPGTGATTVNINSAVDTTHPDNGYQLTLTESGSLGADKGGAIGFQSRYTSGQTYTATFAGIKGRRENATSDNMSGYLQFLTRGAVGSNAERMRITSLGNVGIGISGPEAPLHVHSESSSFTPDLLRLSARFHTHGIGPSIKFRQSSYGGGWDLAEITGIIHGGNHGGSLIFKTGTPEVPPDNGVREQMRIDAYGNVGIGTTAPGALLHVNGSAGNPTGVWSTVSDARLKKNIQPLERALDEVLKLRPVTFEWKDPKDHGGLQGPQRGFIAQEVEKVFPDWVSTDANGAKMITSVGVNAVLVEAIQELRAENQALQKRLEALERR